MEEVIRLAMQQYEMECHDKKKQSKLKGNAKAYVLRFSEDDGSADVSTRIFNAIFSNVVTEIDSRVLNSLYNRNLGRSSSISEISRDRAI